MTGTWSRILFGAPLASRADGGERVGPVRGIAILGLDVLASVAYGPEALLTTLMALGTVASRYVLPLSAAIAAVLVIVSLSYGETIRAYPNGAGSPEIVRQNIGPRAGLLTACALALDAVLNVAVSISAGIGALVSAFPALLPWTVSLCIAVLAILTVINLRGVRSTGNLLVFPTLLFVGCLAITIALGLARMIGEGGHPTPVVAPPRLALTAVPVSTWLLLRAFGHGYTAMTGIDALSAGVSIFRQPSAVMARRALVGITLILVGLLLGVGILCGAYEITATPPGAPGFQNVLSVLVAAVAGRGVFYHVAITSIVVALALSANTSFTAFPRLCRELAEGRYLPGHFMRKGRRLVHSHGIVALAVMSGLLLVLFQGITNRLIPLFAVGALAAFTLAQWGMVEHWRRSSAPRRRLRAISTAFAATAAAVTLVGVIIVKFDGGAWLSVLILAAAYVLFRSLARHYAVIEQTCALAGPVDLHPLPRPHVIVPIRRLDQAAQRAVRFALTLSPDVSVVQVLSADRRHEDLSEQWTDRVRRPAEQAGVLSPRLVVLESEFRELFATIVDYVKQVETTAPDREVAVIVPQIVEARWYHAFLHDNAAALLKALLIARGGPRVVVISVPWHLPRSIGR